MISLSLFHLSVYSLNYHFPPKCNPPALRSQEYGRGGRQPSPSLPRSFLGKVSSDLWSPGSYVWPVPHAEPHRHQAHPAACVQAHLGRAWGWAVAQMSVAALVASDDTCTAVRRDEDLKLTLSGITPRPTAADGWWHHPGRLFSSRAVGSGVEVLIS